MDVQLFGSPLQPEVAAGERDQRFLAARALRVHDLVRRHGAGDVARFTGVERAGLRLRGDLAGERGQIVRFGGAESGRCRASEREKHHAKTARRADSHGVTLADPLGPGYRARSIAP